MRYLFISYNSDKSLKESQWYDTLDQIKKERGVTSNEEILRRCKLSNYSSSDGSGCFLLDFIDGAIDFSFEFENYAYTDILLRLMKQVLRDEKLNELGI